MIYERRAYRRFQGALAYRRRRSPVFDWRAVLALALLPSACAPDDTPLRTTVESAGSGSVEIVRSTEDGYPDVVLRDLIEDLRIGAPFGNPPAEFHEIRLITSDLHGNIYIGQQAPPEVRVFTSRGRYLRKFGRLGDGPGEIRMLDGMFLNGDTLVVLDDSHNRITTFAPDGRTLATVDYPLVEGNHVRIRAVTAVGAIGVIGRTSFGPGPGLAQDTIAIVGLPGMTAGDGRPIAPGDSAHLITEYPGRSWYPAGVEGRSSWAPALWEPMGAAAFDGAGQVYIHSGEYYRIGTYDPRGRLLRQIVRPIQPTDVTDETLDTYRAWARSQAVDSTAGQSSQNVVASALLARADLPHGERIPVLGRMLVSYNGTIWVQRPDLSEHPTRGAFTTNTAQHWDIFAPKGDFVGTVEAPSGFLMLHVTDGAALGVARDSLGTEYVVRMVIQ